jgi:hypothetical protein
MSSTLLYDSSDFAQVPSSLSPEALVAAQDQDWLGQLQLLDLPQLFSFKDASTSDFSSEELDEFTKGVDFNSLESLLEVVTPEAQHDAPGPVRTSSTKHKESPLTAVTPKSSPITISRDELLKFTSEDLEKYVKSITATRTLTSAENKEIKRQRRYVHTLFYLCL